MMIIATVVTIFQTRTLSEEYFIRKNIKSVFEQSFFETVDEEGNSINIPATPFNQIDSFASFESFMQTSITYSIFTDSNNNELQFSQQNMVIGEMVIRTQHH